MAQGTVQDQFALVHRVVANPAELEAFIRDPAHYASSHGVELDPAFAALVTRKLIDVRNQVGPLRGAPIRPGAPGQPVMNVVLEAAAVVAAAAAVVEAATAVYQATKFNPGLGNVAELNQGLQRVHNTPLLQAPIIARPIP